MGLFLYIPVPLGFPVEAVAQKSGLAFGSTHDADGLDDQSSVDQPLVWSTLGNLRHSGGDTSYRAVAAKPLSDERLSQLY